MGQPGEVSFNFPPHEGPYEYVFNNAIGGVWFVTVILFLLSLYYFVRALQHRSLSSSRHQFAKYAMSAQGMFFVVLMVATIYEMIKGFVSGEDLVLYAVIVAPSFFGAIGWAYILRHATVRADFMSIAHHKNKSTSGE
jgi:hypothetical protein